MTTMLHDPPEVAQLAARGDPPIERWPGRVVTRQDIMKASGDPRDWFRYGHRLKAAEKAWGEYIDARQRRRNFMAGFEWNQILVLGDYGSGKTSVAAKAALQFFRLGHAVFSNASCLFGWRLEAEEMYTALGFMPANSVMLIDESSASLAARVAHSVAGTTFGEMNLNIRKRNCVVFYMSAQDWQISANIRRDCKEVWMPVPKDDLEVDGRGYGGARGQANNPDNFRMAWHVWDDYPYRKANLIEGTDANKDAGFGPPAYTMYDEGDLVRWAYLLNDTFELAHAGAATMADREVVKAQLEAFHRGDGPSRAGHRVEKDVQLEQLVMLFQEKRDEPPPFFRAGDIGRWIGVSSSKAGLLMQEFFEVRNIRNHGYPSDELYAFLDQMAGEEERNGHQ